MRAAVDDKIANDISSLNLNGNGTPHGLHDDKVKEDDPFRNVIRRHHRARDVTAEFTRSAKVLNIGQLVKDDTFSLFESVQALEIMDPKMDSGYLAPGETLDDDYSVTQPLLPAEIIYIMDQLLCYEMSWQQGYPLAQNLFTSHHIDYLLSQSRPEKAIPTFRGSVFTGADEPNALTEGVLKAYCLGVIKCCDIVIETIIGQQYYEEEDFNTNTFNRKLLQDVEDDACLRLLEEAASYLAEATDIERSLREGLILRLDMRRNLMSTFLPNDSIQYTAADWSRLHKQVEELQKSHTLAQPHSAAFSAKLQRRLASSTPPRPIVDVKFGDACKDLKTLYVDMQGVLRLGKIWTDHADFPLRNLMTSCASICNRPEPPNALPRALLQALLVADGRLANVPGGNMAALLLDSLRQLLPREDLISEACWAIELPSDWRYELARDIDAFLQEGAPVMEGVLRSWCQNPCRIRRCLANALVDLDTLLARLKTRFGMRDIPSYPATIDASLLEAIKRPSAAASTVLTQILHTSMIHLVHNILLESIVSVVSLGFSQDIYLPHELSTMYSYQSQIHQTHLHHARAHQTFLSNILSRLPRSSRQHHDLQDTINHHNMRNLPIEAEANLSAGLSHLYAFLAAVSPPKSKLNLVQSPYATPSLQHELRMRPFTNLAHAPAFTSASASPTLETASGSNDLPHLHAHLQHASTALTAARETYKNLLKLPISASASASASSHFSLGPDSSAAVAVGALAREESWKKDVQGAMRACLGAGVVVARVEGVVGKATDGGGGQDVELARSGERVKWKVEGLEEREKKGVREWLVPVVDVEA